MNTFFKFWRKSKDIPIQTHEERLAELQVMNMRFSLLADMDMALTGVVLTSLFLY